MMRADVAVLANKKGDIVSYPNSFTWNVIMVSKEDDAVKNARRNTSTA